MSGLDFSTILMPLQHRTHSWDECCCDSFKRVMKTIFYSNQWADWGAHTHTHTHVSSPAPAENAGISEIWRKLSPYWIKCNLNIWRFIYKNLYNIIRTKCHKTNLAHMYSHKYQWQTVWNRCETRGRHQTVLRFIAHLCVVYNQFRLNAFHLAERVSSKSEKAIRLQCAYKPVFIKSTKDYVDS